MTKKQIKEYLRKNPGTITPELVKEIIHKFGVRDERTRGRYNAKCQVSNKWNAEITSFSCTRSGVFVYIYWQYGSGDGTDVIPFVYKDIDIPIKRTSNGIISKIHFPKDSLLSALIQITDV